MGGMKCFILIISALSLNALKLPHLVLCLQ